MSLLLLAADIKKQIWKKASLNLDFTKGSLDSRVTFSRASTGSYYNRAGVITQAAVNLLTYSEQFDNAAWSKPGSPANILVTANAATAPDGTLTADKVYENTTSAQHLMSQTVATTSGQSYAYSVFAKMTSPAEWTSFRLQLGAGGGIGIFDLSTLSASVSGANAVSASIQSVGNGWYRCTLLATSNGSSTNYIYRQQASYVGDGTSGMYFWGAQLETGSTATTYTPTTSSISGAPRFDYDPVTLQPKGLLIEEGRINLLPYSEQVDLWQFINVTPTANATIAPDGNTTADKIAVASSQALGNMYTYQTVSKTASSLTYTASIFAKKAEFNRVSLFVNDNAVTTNRASVVISLVDGSTVTAASTTGTFTAATSTVTPLLNDWYRVTLTFTTSTETLLRFRVYSLDSVATVGNGTSGIYIWGAQLEIGLSSAAAPFPTSYIPTTTGQATRNPDTAAMTGTNFSSWYNQTEGSFYSEFDNPVTANKRLFSANDGTTSNRVSASLSVGSSGSINYTVTQGGTAQVNALLLKTNLDTGSDAFYKTSISYKQDDFAGCVNAETVVTDTSGTVPIVNTQLTIGVNELSNSAWLNGHIKRITYFNKRLANSVLQYLTR